MKPALYFLEHSNKVEEKLTQMTKSNQKHTSSESICWKKKIADSMKINATKKWTANIDPTGDNWTDQVTECIHDDSD